MGSLDYASIDPSPAAVAPTDMSLEGLDLFAQKIQLRRTALWRSIQAGLFVAAFAARYARIALLLDHLRTVPIQCRPLSRRSFFLNCCDESKMLDRLGGATAIAGTRVCGDELRPLLGQLGHRPTYPVNSDQPGS